MKDKVKTLWKLCFDDSESFTELYFQHRYKEELNVEITIDDELMAALQLIDYPIKVWGKTFRSQYISGVCTHPDHRNKGIAKKLMRKAINKMYHEGIAVSSLIPAEAWLANYYRTFGFEYLFDYTRARIEPKEIITDPTVTIVPYTYIYKDRVYSYYAKRQEERDNCLLHTAHDLDVIIADLLMSGELLMAIKENSICGLAFVYEQPQEVTIGEITTDNHEIESSMLYSIYKNANHKEVYLLDRKNPEKENQPTLHLGMCRIINAHQLLAHYAENNPTQKHCFKLEDPIIEANNGYYHLQDGMLKFSSLPHCESCTKISTNELILHLLNTKNLYMNLMLN